MFASEIRQLFRKLVSEHRKAALGRLTRGFVLDDVPMFNKSMILDAQDVRRYPVRRLAEIRKSPVHDYEVSFGHDHSRFVSQSRWKALDKIEEALAARRDMSAVLNIVRGPIASRRPR